jgi:hypothetical protein
VEMFVLKTLMRMPDAVHVAPTWPRVGYVVHIAGAAALVSLFPDNVIGAGLGSESICRLGTFVEGAIENHLVRSQLGQKHRVYQAS